MQSIQKKSIELVKKQMHEYTYGSSAQSVICPFCVPCLLFLSLIRSNRDHTKPANKHLHGMCSTILRGRRQLCWWLAISFTVAL